MPTCTAPRTTAGRFSGPGSRIRLCKGAYRERGSVAFQRPADVDGSYLRCLEVLMAGQGCPMVALHDPRMIDAALGPAERAGRDPADFEPQPVTERGSR